MVIVQRLDSDNVKEIIVTEIHPPARKTFTVELVNGLEIYTGMRQSRVFPQ